jgi:outer membrane immunogenic protein
MDYLLAEAIRPRATVVCGLVCGTAKGAAMKKIISAGIGMLALAGAMRPAAAADLEVTAPVYKERIVVDVWSWAGVYVGVNVGYSWGHSSTTHSFNNSTTGALLFTANGGFDMNGAIGGGQVGYNWQSGSFVAGVEADIQGSGQKGGFTFVCPAGICAAPIPVGGAAPIPGGPVTDAFSQKLTWFGTVRGRFGATVTPSVLIYVTAGLAYGGVKSDLTVSGFNAGVPAAALFSSSVTKGGWTVGAGLEGRIGGNWTAKIEYLYMDLGTINGGPFATPIVAPGGALLAANFSSRITDNIVRVGVNYHFNAPLVARY